MDKYTVVHDLEVLKQDFIKRTGGTYPVCLDYAIEAVKKQEDKDRE